MSDPYSAFSTAAPAADPYGAYSTPQTPTNAPVTATGLAKAAGSGAAHTVLQGAGGGAGDLRDKARSAVDATLGFLVNQGVISQDQAHQAHQFAAGTYRMVSPFEQVNRVTDNIAGLIDAATATNPHDAAPAGQTVRSTATPDAIASGSYSRTLNTEDLQAATHTGYQPRNMPERYAAAVGGALPLAPLAGETIPAKIVGTLAPSVTGQTASEAARAAGATPEEQELAGQVGALVGGVAVPGAADAAGARSTPKPEGPVKAAEVKGVRQFRAAATDPQAVEDTLNAGGQELVPGSQPTTFQVTGDTGVGSLERADRTSNPGVYQQLAADQNAARVQAMPNPQGDPADVGAAIRAKQDAIDAETEAQVNAAAAKASQATDALGGTSTPEDVGASIRQAISDAEKAGRARTSAMYTELGLDDPGVTANVGATRGAASDILASQRPTAKPMGPEEAAIFSAAGSMKPVAPMVDLLELRSRVGAELRGQRAPGGDPSAVRRLTRLQQAIDTNLDSSIADTVENHQAAVSAGQMAPEQAILARMQADVAAFRVRQAEARNAIGSGDPGIAGSGSAGVPSSDRATVSTGGAPGSTAGGAGVPQAGGVQPTVSPDAIPGLRAANAEYKAQRRTFGADPVDDILAQDKSGGYSVLNGEVPGKIFKPGPDGFERVQNAIAAGGDRAQQLIEDYAAQSLRRAAVKADGSIDAAAHARWMKANQDALRALPDDARARLADVGEAQGALGEATANRDAAVKAANADKLGVLLRAADPQDVQRIVGALFNKADAVTQMKALVARLKGDPAAIAGLKQAVADHITTNFIGNTEAATSGDALIKADAFQTFVRKNSGALRVVFDQDELANLHAIAADLQRSARSINALKLPNQSNTAQDIAPLLKAHAGKLAARSVLDMFGFALGYGAGAHAGLPPEFGAAAGAALSEALQAIRDRGMQSTQDVVNRMVRDPAFAKTMLAKVPASDASTTAFQTGVIMRARAIQRALAASAAGQGPATDERKSQ
ncbi:hypothetical protein ACO2Q3_13760 [Caulobacter sp. KR2-114]|uniref:hypothetical protein n=1 Tax=Caulobacter sp. KR2-114 TaxID=3400912 RepID=UPI003C11C9B0